MAGYAGYGSSNPAGVRASGTSGNKVKAEVTCTMLVLPYACLQQHTCVAAACLFVAVCLWYSMLVVQLYCEPSNILETACSGIIRAPAPTGLLQVSRAVAPARPIEKYSNSSKLSIRSM